MKWLHMLAIARAFGLLTGGALYIALCLWRRRAQRKRMTPEPEMTPLIEVETFVLGSRYRQVRLVSVARHVVATVFAAAGPFSWPLLAWRYGARSTTQWCVPLLLLHSSLIVLVVNAEESLVGLSLGIPVVYLLLALRMAAADHARQAAYLRRSGWRSIGRAMVQRNTPASGELMVHPQPAQSMPAPGGGLHDGQAGLATNERSSR